MILKDKTVLFLGDSITEGYLAKTNYPKLIEEEYELKKAINFGLNGTRIAKNIKPTLDKPKHDLYFGLRAKVMPQKLDSIVIFGGTNDYGHGDALIGDIKDTTDTSFYGALNNLIIFLDSRYKNTKIILLTPIHRAFEEKNLNGYTLNDYVVAIKNIAKRHNVSLIDLYNDFKIDITDKKFSPDGLHLTTLGQEKLASYLGSRLASL